MHGGTYIGGGGREGGLYSWGLMRFSHIVYRNTDLVHNALHLINSL